MLEYILIGSGFALAAAVQPGPLQAFFLSSVAQKGWKRTLPAAFAPLLSDGPIALVILLILQRVPEVMTSILRGVGGIFLFYLAWRSYREWKQRLAVEPESEGNPPRTLLQAALVNLLNPGPYLGWSLVLGPAFLEAWGQSPLHAVTLVVAFYATMIVALAGTIVLLGVTRFLGAEGRRTLILVSAILLAGLGLYQVGVSLFRVFAI
ncbi:MAG: hypothetical protein MAG431_00858 [Chloroflexi bacterium]|nr:hypothetical protein [Chloroflexota bacterium]